ncbi:M13 family metallopeptidase [Archangium violaceum]|uniref:M13 family metallopeptidase n=1 Tax=Archangium violaceum TaxID=83451 RepID=UPI0019512223|nr:M13 family metallopeptidase [Archangium violaceum]QRO01969.1 M13 family metallopeptidase [Archangium violaceum]
MRLLKVFLAAAVFPITAFAQGTAQRGIEVGDLNRSVEPCSDFYEYANGQWRAQNPIPPSMVRWSRRFASGELAKEQLKGILEEVSRKQDWPTGSVEQLIGDHYASCMDEARLEAQGLTPIKPLLTDIDGVKSAADVQRMIRRFHELDIAVPFALGAASDNHNPSQMITDIAARGLGMPDRDYYLKPEPRFKEAREKYLEHVANTFKLAGYTPEAARAAASTVFALESKLAEASLDNVALRDPKATDHKTSFADLRKLTPRFDWVAYFQGAKLPRADLNVEQPRFLQEVDRQLQQTPVADWKTYLKWHLLHSASQSLSRPFQEEIFSFYGRYLGGAKEEKPRWKRCVESTDALLGEALGRKYTEKYFPPEAKARMQEMVKNLLAAMGDSIQGLDWMGPETKKKALEKLSTFNPKIGYPDKWKDYSHVKIRRDAFWANVMAGRRFNVVDDWSQIGKAADRGRWGMTPPTSNAYYHPLLNEIVFPAGILQPPAFSMEATDAVNYGAIGVVIGHEISHGFDDQGAQYDARGRLSNWWTDEDLVKFQARGQCVVDQFESYFIEPGLHHNGKLVLGESIGDLAGARIAYLAFKKSQQGKPPAPTLDGFTPDQQFFISWGQFRGDAIRPETQRLMIQGDPHPTGKYRVIGPLSNMREFQQAFSCKQDAEMVRPAEKRCEVW